MVDHLTVFTENVVFVLMTYGLVGITFAMCFRGQLLFSWRDSIFMGSAMGLALFFLWLLMGHTAPLAGVMLVLAAALAMWALRN